jgi:hypothetical protein
MMISQALSAIYGYIFPTHRTMVKTYDLILAPHRAWDTEVFLSVHGDAASEDPKVITESKRITNMTLSKLLTGVEHELIINEVEDKGQTKKIVLERTVCPPEDGPADGPDDATVDQFMEHPDSKKLLEAIKQSIENIPPPVLVAGAAIAAPMLQAQGIPQAVVASVAIPLAVASALLPSSSQDRPPLTKELRDTLMEEGLDTRHGIYSAAVVPQYSPPEQATMAVAQALQTLIDSPPGRYVSDSLNKPLPPKNTRANDRFVGSELLNTTDYSMSNRNDSTSFRPVALTLFHVALLAHVIHLEYPLYSLFKGQCYWYASLVFYAAQIIDRNLADNRRRAEGDFPDFQDYFFMPYRLCHSVATGCWNGIRVTGPRQVVLARVVKKFHQQLDKLIDEVFFYNPSKLPLFTNFLSVYEVEGGSRRPIERAAPTAGVQSSSAS